MNAQPKLPQAHGHSCHSAQAAHPVDVLMDEHQVVLAVCAAIDAEIAAPGPLATRADWWRGVLEFIENFLDLCHHEKEEQLLFPAMTRHGFPDEQGPLAVMRGEHQEGRDLLRSMQHALETQDAHLLVHAATAFVVLLREHIAKENHVLFVLARQVLPAETAQEVLHDMQRFENEKIVPGQHCRYVALARALCADRGVDFASQRDVVPAGGCCSH